jgi:hypothetical protein
MKERQNPFSMPIYENISKDKKGRQDELFLTSEELISQIHGLLSRLTQDEEHRGTDAIVLLDRGAAPLDQFISTLYPFYTTVSIPPLFHINIGRATISKNGANIPFNGNPEIIKKSFPESLTDLPSHLLILDDYTKSGETLKKARAAFKRAYPQSRIETTTAFTKIPNWQGEPTYTGLEEYTFADYCSIAIEKLNEENIEKGIFFESFGDLLGRLNDDTRWAMYRFNDLIREISGTLPFAKPVETPIFSKQIIEQEIDVACQEVIKRYLLKS